MTDAERIVAEAMQKQNQRELFESYCKGLGAVIWAVAFAEKAMGMKMGQWLYVCWKAWKSLSRR